MMKKILTQCVDKDFEYIIINEDYLNFRLTPTIKCVPACGKK